MPRFFSTVTEARANECGLRRAGVQKVSGRRRLRLSKKKYSATRNAGRPSRYGDQGISRPAMEGSDEWSDPLCARNRLRNSF